MDQPSDPMRLDVALTERLQDYAAARGIDLQEAFETALGECRSAPRDGEDLGTVDACSVLRRSRVSAIDAAIMELRRLRR
jgi:hypothetical protein